jgi:hypothetical protein
MKRCGEPRRDVGAFSEEMPNRPGDLRYCERRGRDLVEKRLKQVMISSIDKRDANWRAGETSDCFQAAKSGADNDHVRTARNRAGGSLKPGGVSQPSFPASANRRVGHAVASRLPNREDLNLATVQVD